MTDCDRWVADTTQVFIYFVGNYRSSNPTCLNVIGSKLTRKVSVLIGQLLTCDLRETICRDCRRPSQTHVPIKIFLCRPGRNVWQVQSSSTLLIIEIVCRRPSERCVPIKIFFCRRARNDGKLQSSSILPIIQIVCRRPSQTTF